MDNSAGQVTSTNGLQAATTSEPSESWELLVLTPQKMEWIWEQVQRFPIIFDDFGKGNKKAFFDKLMNPANGFVDIGPGKGIACLFNIRPRLDANCHIVMFDRKLKGREPLLKQVLAYAFSVLCLRRLTAWISEDAYLASALAERLGFRLE